MIREPREGDLVHVTADGAYLGVGLHLGSRPTVDGREGLRGGHLILLDDTALLFWSWELEAVEEEEVGDPPIP